MLDNSGNPALTVAGSSNPWWVLLEEAVRSAGGELENPEIFPASTDARYFRRQGLPAIGFSPMANTPILLHDHNEVHSSLVFFYYFFCTLADLIYFGLSFKNCWGMCDVLFFSP